MLGIAYKLREFFRIPLTLQNNLDGTVSDVISKELSRLDSRWKHSFWLMDTLGFRFIGTVFKLDLQKVQFLHLWCSFNQSVSTRLDFTTTTIMKDKEDGIYIEASREGKTGKAGRKVQTRPLWD